MKQRMTVARSCCGGGVEPVTGSQSLWQLSYAPSCDFNGPFQFVEIGYQSGNEVNAMMGYYFASPSPFPLASSTLQIRTGARYEIAPASGLIPVANSKIAIDVAPLPTPVNGCVLSWTEILTAQQAVLLPPTFGNPLYQYYWEIDLTSVVNSIGDDVVFRVRPDWVDDGFARLVVLSTNWTLLSFA